MNLIDFVTIKQLLEKLPVGTCGEWQQGWTTLLYMIHFIYTIPLPFQACIFCIVLCIGIPTKSEILLRVAVGYFSEKVLLIIKLC
jgi:hypothetical protein